MKVPQSAIGRLNEDGSVAEWPATDVRGKPYRRNGMTTRRIQKSYFVIIPRGFNEPLEIEETPQEAEVLEVIPPVAPSEAFTWEADSDEKD
jgi:hypothetical protein